MAETPNEDCLKYGWLAKARMEAVKEVERMKREKFERESKMKDEYKKNNPTYPPEVWQQARDAFKAGKISEYRFPIIITPSQGPFTSPAKLQQFAGLERVPKVKWTTTSSLPGGFIEEYSTDMEEQDEGEAEGRRQEDHNGKQDGGEPAGSSGEAEAKSRPKLFYCDVTRAERERIMEATVGETVVVWFQGVKRAAWLAHSVKDRKSQGDASAKSNEGCNDPKEAFSS